MSWNLDIVVIEAILNSLRNECLYVSILILFSSVPKSLRAFDFSNYSSSQKELVLLLVAFSFMVWALVWIIRRFAQRARYRYRGQGEDPHGCRFAH